MQHTFAHVLGLPTSAALAILSESGITEVSVQTTQAPAHHKPSQKEQLRSQEGERLGYAQTRVVAVKDEGKTLIVSRFLCYLKEEISNGD